MKKIFTLMLITLLLPLTAAAKAAYAVYNDFALTFYYDDNQSGRPGLKFGLNDVDESGIPNWCNEQAGNILTVKFDASFAEARPTSMKCWFCGLDNLQQIVGMENLNTSEVTDMYGLFQNCKKLGSVDLNGFDTGKVTDMTFMFCYCTSLTNLDLTSFDTHSVLGMRYMFQNCSGLTTIFCGDQWSTGKVSKPQSQYMFFGCTSLVGGEGTTYDIAHLDKDYAHVDGGPSNPGYLTKTVGEPYAVYENGTLTFYYDEDKEQRTGDVYGIEVDLHTLPGWINSHASDIVKVVFQGTFVQARPKTTRNWFYNCKGLQQITGLNFLNTSEVTDMEGMFRSCESLTSLDVSGFNTGKVTAMSLMFESCKNLTDIDVSGWKTNNVKYMNYLFYRCESLKSLDLRNWVTGNVTNMSYMFMECYKLKSLDIRGWNTGNVTNMYAMFWSCRELTTLDVSQFDTEKVEDLSLMFANCQSLTDIDVSRWKTENVTNMYRTFDQCVMVKELDLSSWDTGNVTSMQWTFIGCNSLTTIYCGEGWSTEKVVYGDDMFTWCNSLVGGKGTAYDYEHRDVSYAHVDGGTNNPGYLTFKGDRLLGDVNGDGLVNSADVQKVYALMAQNADGNNHPEADVNGDGNVNSADIQKIYAIMASI